MAEKEDFYQELDSKTRHSYCTCQTMALAFGLLAILLATGIAVGVKKVTTVVSPEREVTATRTDALRLQEKVAELNTAPGASTTLVLTEQELTGLLIEALKKEPNIPLRGVQTEINPDSVIITGTATQWVTSTVQITVLPKVVDGRAKLELVKIQAGSLAVPAQLTSLLASQLDSLLDKQLNQLTDVTIKSITLSEGKMRLTGTISGSVTPDPS